MANYGDLNSSTGKLYTPTEIMRINSGLNPVTGLTLETSTSPAFQSWLEVPKEGKPTFKDPITGQPCTEAEYSKACALAGITPTAPTGVQDVSGLQASLEGGWTTSDPYSSELVSQMMSEGTFPSAGILWGQAGAPTMQQLLSGNYPQVGVTPTPTPATDMPVFGEGAAAQVPTPEVTPAPPYVIPPEMQEMMDLYGGILTDWVTNPQGIPPETQAQMIQLQTDTLKAREQEAIRVMTNNMERRGITNSGFVQANTNMITSNTSVAIAGAIADVQIKSALMKMASFEKGMGAMANFLGFLSEQSQLAHLPKFQTWQAEQLATMQAWQGKMDVYKMELNQAYQTQNMTLQAELTSQLNQEQNAFNLELAEMEIEANQEIAMAQGIWGIFGTILGWMFGK